MTTTQLHTPTPWLVVDDPDGTAIASADLQVVVARVTGEGLTEETANAAHIVQCVNVHEELIKALNAVALLAKNHKNYHQLPAPIVSFAQDIDVLIQPVLALAEGGHGIMPTSLLAALKEVILIANEGIRYDEEDAVKRQDKACIEKAMHAIQQAEGGTSQATI